MLDALLLDLSGVLYDGDTLIPGALNAGLNGCLVRTGKYRSGDEDKIAGDFAVVDSVVEVVELAFGG